MYQTQTNLADQKIFPTTPPPCWWYSHMQTLLFWQSYCSVLLFLFIFFFFYTHKWHVSLQEISNSNLRLGNRKLWHRLFFRSKQDETKLMTFFSLSSYSPDSTTMFPFDGKKKKIYKCRALPQMSEPAMESLNEAPGQMGALLSQA